MRRGLAGHVFFRGVALAQKRGAQVMPEFWSPAAKPGSGKSDRQPWRAARHDPPHCSVGEDHVPKPESPLTLPATCAT